MLVRWFAYHYVGVSLLKLCFAVSEFFGWGKFGGYGSSTRILATELAKRGVDISVVTPRRGGQPEKEIVMGVRVLSFPPQSLRTQYDLYRACDADIYHFQEPSLGTYLAMKAAPSRIHVVTCRDTRLWKDWLIELRNWVSEGRFKTLLTFPYENNRLVTHAVRNANAVFCPNEFSIPITRKKYGLNENPLFLPSPVKAPQIRIEKAERPTVCYIGRLDKRKRPTVFFELANQFPDVFFIALGQATKSRYDAELRQRYAQIPNLNLMGFINQFSSDLFQQILSKSWILVNTALREGLPRSFIEAGLFECAILSAVDPDGFATRFGYRVRDDDFASGLRILLERKAWKRRGKKASAYVKVKHGLERSVSQHLEVYKDLLVKQPRSKW